MFFGIDAAYHGFASILGKITGKDLHRSALSGAVRPKESNDLSFADRKGNGIHRPLFAIDFYKTFTSMDILLLVYFAKLA